MRSQLAFASKSKPAWHSLHCSSFLALTGAVDFKVMLFNDGHAWVVDGAAGAAAAAMAVAVADGGGEILRMVITGLLVDTAAD